MNHRKQDAERLVAAVLPFAKSMVERRGEFHPFGAYLRANDEIVDAGALAGDEKHPSATELVKVLRASFKRMMDEGTLRAAAVVTNVRVKPPGQETPSDAIQVSVDHSELYSAEVFFPYQIAPRGGVSYSPSFAQEGAYWLQDA
jgi:hypothetical protein